MKNQDYRLHTQRKNNQSLSSVASSTPVPGIFESRPFVVQQKQQGSSQPPNLKASLMGAERYGHHLQKIYPINNNQTSKTLQPKLETGKQQNQETSSQELPIQRQPTPPRLPYIKGLSPYNADRQFLGDRQAETRRELEQLRASQKPETYQEQGQGGDLRRITQDPRFATKYKLDRESDTKNFGERITSNIGKTTTEAVRTNVGKEKPGENFHDRYEQGNETKIEKAKRKFGENKPKIVMTAAGLIPGANIPISHSRAEQQSKRQQGAAQIAIAADIGNNPNPLASNIAKGFVDDAKQQKNFEHINTAVSAATLPLSVIPGLGQGVQTSINAGLTGSKFIGQKVYAANKSKDLEARKNSRMPDSSTSGSSSYNQQVDKANQSLIGLGAKDANFGRAIVAHLSEPALGNGVTGIRKEIALNKEIHLGHHQASPSGAKDQLNKKFLGKTQTNIPTIKGKEPASGIKGKMGMTETIDKVVEEPNMKPSEVKRLAQQEKARLRQKEQMGDHLDALNKNQEKKWFEEKLF